uniref:Integrase zinc-binding domain-containing protein n=1 Tax=Plectus sambesii TaxID=2011161 RepID=A0A914X037_9BILA
MTADKNKKTPIGSQEYEYGSYSTEEYERIFAFKRDGTVPTFEELEESKHKGKRSTFKHKCANFYISPDGTSLMYCKMNKTESKRMANGKVEQLEEKKMRWVFQKGEVERIIRSVHEGIGHLMINNTYDHIKDHFYWDGIQDDVCAFISACIKCQKNRPFKNQPAVLRPIPPPNNALSQWGMDLVTLPETDEGYHYLIVAVDHLTKWPEAQPIKRKTTANAEEDRLQAFLDGVEEHYKQLQNNRLNAHTKIKIEQSKQKTAYNTKHAPCPFKKGDKVLLQNSQQLLHLAKQFETRFTGPYFINRVTQANTCYLMRNDTTALKKPVSAAHLKLFI